MKVYFVGKKQSLKFKRIVKKSALLATTMLSQPTSISICVNFVDDEEIRLLNKETRNVDKVTDILSFPTFNLNPGDVLDVNSVEAKVCAFKGVVPVGDMAINMAELYRQSKEYGVTVEQELAKLVIHSMLHLFGYDHIKDEDFAVMKPLEDEILSKMTKL